MQDPSDSMEHAEPEGSGQSDTTGSPVLDDPTPDPDNDAAAASTVIAEVLPGIAMVFGEVPPELKPDLLDFGFVSVADRKQISTVLASIGNAATVAGNLGHAYAGAQGLYRISRATQALLKAGGTLAVKDGANLGTVMFRGRIIAQSRFIPVNAVSAAQNAASIGPALAMVALQMQLTEVEGLVRTNIALTSQVLTKVRLAQWAELTALVATVDHVVVQAREVGSVPTSLWETVAGKRADLRTQRDLYRLNVGDHIRQIQQLDGHARREYLETNAEAIVFDAHALLSSVKAWIGYQALHAARARAAGPEDTGEALLVESIVRDTRTELDAALTETTSLVDSLTRELRIIAELPGRDTLQLPGKRKKDSIATRQTSALLLEAIEPLADALHPPAPQLEAPDVVCAPEALDLAPYLRVLRWFLKDGETLRVIGFPDQLDALAPISAIFSGAKDKLASARDKMAAKTLVAVTDRRIITARTNAFLEQGEIRGDIPIDQVRYVRAKTAQDKNTRVTIDVITRDENTRWLFQADIDNAQVDALAAVLAESMTIPDVERDELRRRARTPIEAGTKSEITGATPSTKPTGSEAATSDTE
ncbi:hypothetical protein [Streptomyces sp. NPDC005302]|uniref:hypothetical protein n=1 Tax=Streptomyces sp. NPDC005302 TaxID=3154675 RepID=UPI0033B02112